jgi:hypothetical protein
VPGDARLAQINSSRARAEEQRIAELATLTKELMLIRIGGSAGGTPRYIEGRAQSTWLMLHDSVEEVAAQPEVVCNTAALPG